MQVELRSVQDLAEYEACVEVQRATWGESFSGIVPASLMMVAAKVGGLAAGAFGEDGELLGFVFGLAGFRNGERIHWSHMLAVRDEARGRGLGRQLKLYQRDHLLRRGFSTAYWTFDPLVARNAHLNLNRLGATIVDYEVNLYGTVTRSRLHSHAGTDRFIVRWELEGDRTERALRGETVAEDEPYRDAPVVTLPSAHGRSLPPGRRGQETEPPEEAGEGLPESTRVLIEIPWDVQARKEADPDEVARWRRLTRRAFPWYLSRGYEIEGLQRDLDAKRAFYQARST